MLSFIFLQILEEKNAIHFSELFVFMRLIICLLKSTSYQPELFPLQFLKITDFIHTVGRSLCIYYYIFVRENKQTSIHSLLKKIRTISSVPACHILA